MNECGSNACLYNATCVDDVNGYTCECINGSTGLHCETGEWILLIVCIPPGVSPLLISCFKKRKTLFERQLILLAIFITWFPDINECDSFPCFNNGTCTDLFNMYTCTCATAYTDTYCHIGKVYLILSFL